MSKYRKRPVVVEAMHFSGLADLNECAKFCAGNMAWADADGKLVCAVGEPNAVAITTLEGTMVAREGDWIIRGVRGEFYSCKPDIFEATYEPVAELEGKG